MSCFLWGDPSLHQGCQRIEKKTEAERRALRDRERTKKTRSRTATETKCTESKEGTVRAHLHHDVRRIPSSQRREEMAFIERGTVAPSSSPTFRSQKRKREVRIRSWNGSPRARTRGRDGARPPFARSPSTHERAWGRDPVPVAEGIERWMGWGDPLVPSPPPFFLLLFRTGSWTDSTRMLSERALASRGTPGRMRRSAAGSNLLFFLGLLARSFPLRGLTVPCARFPSARPLSGSLRFGCLVMDRSSPGENMYE